MSRESDIAQALVELADTLVEDYDVIDVLTALTDRCRDVLGVSAAGVLLAAPDGELRMAAASSDAMRVLELLQLQAQQGPCLDAFHAGELVQQHHLEAGSGRWPEYATAALQAGFRSVVALPLRLRDTTLGALNLMNVDPAPMPDGGLIVARAFADLAAISLLQHRTATDTQRLNEQLTHALTSRIAIEQAKGVIAERAGVDMAQAFALLRRYARNNNLRLTDVAQAAVENTLHPSAWAPA